MIYYAEDIVPIDTEGDSQNDSDNVSLNETLQNLTESISRLNENLESATATEEESEVVTEELTEEILEEDLPLQKKDMMALQESMDSVNDSLDTLVKLNERSLEEGTTEDSTSALVYLDETVDTHLYLTSQVENATINDVYTIGLSIRNVLVLALLLGLSLFFFKLARTALERMLNR